MVSLLVKIVDNKPLFIANKNIRSTLHAISLNFFELFFKGEYIKGCIVAPYLFLGPLLLMLFQVIGNQFLVVKKTWLV